MTEPEKVKAVAKILKDKFTNLSALDVIDLAFKIVDAVKDKEEK